MFKALGIIIDRHTKGKPRKRENYTGCVPILVILVNMFKNNKKEEYQM